MTEATILVLDFGSQYTQLITREIREQSVYSLQLPWNIPQHDLINLNPRGIILSGGPASIYDQGAPQLPGYLFELNVPILGICYGMQAMADLMGGEVLQSKSREFGKALLEVETTNPLIPQGSHQVWMSHGDRIEKVPPGFEILGKTANSPVAVMGDLTRAIYGVQFHPEVRHTLIGTDIIKNYLFDICQLNPTWTPDSIINQNVTKIRDEVGPKQVIAAVSGGVDSSVAAALVHQAIGDQLNAVFVDTGLLRKGEKQLVINTLQDVLKINLRVVEAADQFLTDLKGIVDPEQKRAVIGKRFIRLFEQQAQQLGNPPYLMQGTIYPDVVESSSPDRKQTDTIKTHHNVGGLPLDMEFKLIEPLRYLFKDEVRRIGLELDLPPALIWRQPFPGPGLAIRCIGEITKTRIDQLREADAIFREELEQDNLLVYQKHLPEAGSSQAFAVHLPVKSVGVMGDQRTYQYVIALRAVTTDDFMTADWSRFDPELLARISNRIVNEVPGINRVVYDITSKPPGTIEWE
jgi:GMP synthase (glutamine-hydrolysing)